MEHVQCEVSDYLVATTRKIIREAERLALTRGYHGFIPGETPLRYLLNERELEVTGTLQNIYLALARLQTQTGTLTLLSTAEYCPAPVVDGQGKTCHGFSMCKCCFAQAMGVPPAGFGSERSKRSASVVANHGGGLQVVN